MVQLKNKRGVVIEHGKSDFIQESISAQWIVIIVILSICGFLWYTAYKFYMENESFVSVLMTIFFPFLLLFFLNIWVSFEKSAIYEKGITHSRSWFIDKIMGKSFVPYEKIRCIIYNHLKNENSIEYIFIRGKKSTLLPPFESEHYNETFLKNLYQILKTKCPNARWVEYELDEIEKILSDKNSREKFDQQTREYLNNESE